MIHVTASGSSWIDDAVAGIATGDVYVDPDVSDAAGLQQALAGVLPSDGSFAIVVLPAEANLQSPYDTYILEQLTSAADQQTVVLAIGNDLMADSAVIGEDALRIANEHDAVAAGDLQAGLTETVQAIVEATPTGPAEGGAGTDPLLPLIIGGAVLIVAAGSAAGFIVRRRRRAATLDDDPVPADIRLRVNRLRALRADYAALPRDAIAAETTDRIDALASNVEQLFTRLSSKAGQDQKVLAEVEYSDKLARLVAALDRDYLLDLLTRPDLWQDPQGRIMEVREALTAFNTQIIDNIKQVNARKGLLFQVSLDSLIGRSELRDWERRFSQGAES